MPDRRPAAVATPDPTADRLARLKDLFPDALADGRFDCDKLKELLGDAAAAGRERFRFGWAGRSDALALLRTPSRATLLPDPAESLDAATTKNLIVEGDNLEVLKLLARPYAGRVKRIYRKNRWITWVSSGSYRPTFCTRSCRSEPFRATRRIY